MTKNNGYAKWIAIALALLTLAYNSVATHVIAKNEIKHLQADVQEIKTLLLDHILDK